jgi:hypothetical protein
MQSSVSATFLRQLYQAFRSSAYKPFIPNVIGKRTLVDLSFSRFEHDSRVTGLPPDLAVLMVGVAARQAASPTAMIHARLSSGIDASGAGAHPFAHLCASDHGAFNARVAAMFTRWKGG